MQQHDDADLVRWAQEDPGRFSALYDRHYAPLKRYVLRRVLDHAVASDIVSETFLKALLALPRYRWRGVPFAAWLYRIALNEVNLYFRKRTYAPLRLTEHAAINGLDPRAWQTPLEERAAWERELELNRAFAEASRIIAGLSPHYQDALTLRYFGGKSIGEIAAILDKPEGTIKSLLARGLEKVRERMQPFTG